MKSRKSTGLLLHKLDRIEHKCDKILSELLIIRHSRTRDVDELIKRMRCQASDMRRQCKEEQAILKRMLDI